MKKALAIDKKPWPFDLLEPEVAPTKETQPSEVWTIRRGKAGWAKQEWLWAALVEEENQQPYLAVMESMEKTQCVSFKDLWPRVEGVDTAPDWAGRLKLRQPSLFLRALECPTTDLADMVEKFQEPGDAACTEVLWRDKAAEECFSQINLDDALLEPDPPGGVFFEGELTLFEPGEAAATLFAASQKGSAPLLVKGLVSTANEDDGRQPTAVFLSLSWEAPGKEESPLLLQLELFRLSVIRLEADAFITPEHPRLSRLLGEVALDFEKTPSAGKSGKKQYQAAIEVDLDAQEARFSAQPDASIEGLAWLEDVIGKERIKQAAGGFFKGLSKIKFRLTEVHGSIAWKEKPKLQRLAVSITAEQSGGERSADDQRIKVAGGSLTPSLTLTADFSSGKMQLDVEISGEMEWEKLKLRARLNTGDKSFEAGLDLHDESQQDFIGTLLDLEPVVPEKKATDKDRGADEDGEATLELELEGNYEEKSLSLEVATGRWYRLKTSDKNAAPPLKIGDFYLRGSFADEPRKWDLGIGGRAIFSSGAEFGLEGSYLQSHEGKEFHVAFTAEKLKFGDLLAPEKQAGGKMQSPGRGKELTSLKVAWDSKWPLKGAAAHDLHIQARATDLNLIEAAGGLLGWQGAEKSDFSVKIDELDLHLGTTKKSLALKAAKMLEGKIGAAEFSLQNVSLSFAKEGSAAVTGEACGTLHFHTWGTVKAEYKLNGDWSATLEYKPEQSGGKLGLQQVVKVLTDAEKGAVSWDAEFDKVSLTVMRKGSSHSAELTVEVKNLGKGLVGVVYSKGQWGLGMMLALDALPEDRAKHAAHRLNEGPLAKEVHDFMQKVALQDLKLGFCTLNDQALPGATMMEGKAGFFVSGTWNLAETEGELEGLTRLKQLLRINSGSFEAKLVLTRELKKLTVKVAATNLKEGGSMSGELGVALINGNFEISMTAVLTEFKVAGTDCSAQLTLKAGTGPAGVFLLLEGGLSATGKGGQKGTKGIPLWKGSKAELDNVGLMIGVNPAGISFGAWASLRVGEFAANVLLYFAGANQSAVAFAISDIDLHQTVGIVYPLGDSEIASVLKRIKLLGIPVKPAASKALPGGKSAVTKALPDQESEAIETARRLLQNAEVQEDLVPQDKFHARPSVTEGSASPTTWHLTNERTLTQYTLQRKNGGCELVRKCQFRLVTGTVEISAGAEKTLFKPGVSLSARLDVLGWTATAVVDVYEQGAYIFGHMDPLTIKLGGFTLLEIGAAVIKDKNITLDSSRGPVLSVATFKAGRGAPTGVELRPEFLKKHTAEDFFSGPHAYANGCLRWAGVVMAGVDCQISEQGAALAAGLTLGSENSPVKLTTSLEIAIFRDSGASISAGLEFATKKMEIDLKLFTISIPNIRAGGFLKIQVGGADTVFSAALGAYFEHEGQKHVLAAGQVRISSNDVRNMAVMLRNAVIDGLMALLGLGGEIKTLEEKGRWARVEIINDTPLALQWQGSDDGYESDIKPYKGAHGKFWQRPHDIAPFGCGSFSSCNENGSWTGCGGVTSFQFVPTGESKNSSICHLQVGWSDPVFSSLADSIAKAAKIVGIAEAAKRPAECHGKLLVQAPGRQAAKEAANKSAQALWEDLGEKDLAPSDQNIELQVDGTTMCLEVITLPGDNCRVILREQGVIIARKVKMAVWKHRAEMAVLSPAGILYCQTRRAKYSAWCPITRPKGLARAILKIELITLVSGEAARFVLLAIGSDYKLYHAVKAASEPRARWQAFQPCQTGDLKIVPREITADPNAKRTDTCDVWVTSSDSKKNAILAVSLNAKGEVVFEVPAETGAPAKTSVATDESIRQVVMIKRKEGDVALGLSDKGMLKIQDKAEAVMHCLYRRRLECDEAYKKFYAIQPRPRPEVVSHVIYTCRNALTKIVPDNGFKPLDKEIKNADDRVNFLGEALVKYKDSHVKKYHLKPPSVDPVPKPVRCAGPSKIEDFSVLVFNNTLQIFALDEAGAVWRISQAPNAHFRQWCAGELESKKALANDELPAQPPYESKMYEWFRAKLPQHAKPASTIQLIQPGFYEWSRWEQMHPQHLLIDEKKQECRIISLAVAASAEDHLELFAVDHHGRFWHNWCDAGMKYNGWKRDSLPVPKQEHLFEKVQVMPGADNQLEVILITRQKRLLCTSLVTAATKDRAKGWASWHEIKPGKHKNQ